MLKHVGDKQKQSPVLKIINMCRRLSKAMSPESQRRKGGSKLFMQKLCEQKRWATYCVSKNVGLQGCLQGVMKKIKKGLAMV